jgi:hypothetical protein
VIPEKKEAKKIEKPKEWIIHPYREKDFQNPVRKASKNYELHR